MNALIAYGREVADRAVKTFFQFLLIEVTAISQSDTLQELAGDNMVAVGALPVIAAALSIVSSWLSTKTNDSTPSALAP